MGATIGIDIGTSGTKTLAIDASGKIVAPGFVDCHTHALYVGDRSNEHSLRLRGATYAEIAARGGGIASTVRALRAADDEHLLATLRARLDRMATFGTGVVSDELIQKAVLEVFDLRPAAIIRDLDLLRPIYAKTSAYGHFGRELPEFTWEQASRVDALKAAAGI